MNRDHRAGIVLTLLLGLTFSSVAGHATSEPPGSHTADGTLPVPDDEAAPPIHPTTDPTTATITPTHLLGDWWGLRSWLEKNGIHPGFVYTVDLLWNTSGGDPQYEAFDPLGGVDLSLEVDTEKIGLWKGGTLFIHFQSISGRSNEINRRIYNPLNSVSDLNANKTTQLSELFYRHTLIPDRLYLKFGKQDANTDFATSPASGAFLNAGISPPGIVPVPSYPDPSLGFALFATVEEGLKLSAGVFGNRFEGQSVTDSGLFSGDLFAVAEVSYGVEFNRYRAEYKMGAWYRSEPPPWNYRGPAIEGDYGTYLIVDQPLLPEGTNVKGWQGLSAFFQMAWAPADRNNFDVWLGGGFVYTGLLPGRQQDRTGIAVVYSHSSAPYRRAGYTREIVVEWFYDCVVTDWLIIKPDFQYFSSPRGTPNDATVLGLRTIFVF
ncbi:carbohydrate porin [Myxococcota bacterium]|nr:carbohydrate porin [Myxococcota bacterium]